MGWLDALLPQPGDKWWGSKYLKAVFDKIVEQVDGKAALDHEHGAAGSLIVTRGDAAARSGTGTTLHMRTDKDAVERVVDGVPTSTLASQHEALGAPLPLMNWQTDPDQYTVLSQDAYDSDGMGQDLLYKYAFPPDVFSAMYTQLLMPYGGYDLDFTIPYRMSTSNAGAVVWHVYYRVLAIGEVYSEITSWSEWAAVDDAVLEMIHTPPATANQRDGTSLAIPKSAYNAYDTIQIALARNGGHASDNHPGYAEVDDGLIIVPVTW